MKENHLLKTFMELVKISSPSREEEKIKEWIIKYLKKLGITAICDSFGNIIAKIEGVKCPYFILNAHLDTVQPCTDIKPCIKDNIITSDGTTILGADDKAGLAAILELIYILKTNHIKHCHLEIIFTVQEEIGTMGVQKLNYALIDAKTGITIDGGKINEIIIGAPHIFNLNINITGKAAHSGIEPEKGINAIKVAADAISKIKLGRIDKETTANVGIIKGGTVRNCIPGEVEIKAEVRSHNFAKANRQINRIKKVFEATAKKYKAQLNLNVEHICHGYKFARTSPLLKKIKNSYKIQDLQQQYILSGGGSDANVFHAHNIKVANIGTGARNVHTVNEEISIDDLNKIPEILLELVKV